MCESICLKDRLCVCLFFGLLTYTLKDLFTKSISLRNQIRKAFGVTLVVKVEKGGTVWLDGRKSDCYDRTSPSATLRTSAYCLIQSVNP